MTCVKADEAANPVRRGPIYHPINPSSCIKPHVFFYPTSSTPDISIPHQDLHSPRHVKFSPCPITHVNRISLTSPYTRALDPVNSDNECEW